MSKSPSDQAAQWDFGNFFVPVGLPKLIVGDADGIFSGMFKKTFQETLLIPLQAVARGNHKSIRNEGFNGYLNKVQNIKSLEKGRLNQW